MSNPFQKTDGRYWWWYDETTKEHGPYYSQTEAMEELLAYAVELEQKHQESELQKPLIDEMVEETIDSAFKAGFSVGYEQAQKLYQPTITGPQETLLTIDHSQRSSWQMCKRMYLLRHICGIHKAMPESAGFSYGSAFHASTEVIDLGFDIATAMETFTSMFDFPNDKVRTLVRAKSMLEQYATYVKAQNWTFLQQAKDTMEIAFNEPLTQRINYAGKCDRQFSDGSIGEWKTTYYLYNSSGNSMPYLQQWWGHNSIRGYAWARNANRVYVLGAGVFPQKDGRGGKEYPCIAHLAIPIKEWEIEQFKREATEVGEEIIAYCQRNDLAMGVGFEENLEKVLSLRLFENFPTNTSRCYFNVNNPCQFIDLCTRDVPRGLVEGNYIVDPFLPWLEENGNS